MIEKRTAAPELVVGDLPGELEESIARKAVLRENLRGRSRPVRDDARQAVSAASTAVTRTTKAYSSSSSPDAPIGSASEAFGCVPIGAAMDVKKLSAVLPSPLAEALARRAELHDRSLSAEIRQAVRAYLSSTDRTPQNGSGDTDTTKETTS